MVVSCLMLLSKGLSPRILSGVVKCLSSRGTSICTEQIISSFSKKKTFLADGYPFSVINKTSIKIDHQKYEFHHRE